MADYVSLSTFKEYLGAGVDDTNDTYLSIALAAAQRAIEVACNQVFTEPIPATIQMATMIQAARLVKRKEAPFGVAGSPDMGNELRLLNRLDPDVELLISGERNWWGAV